METTALIYQQIPKIMSEVQPIAKDRDNVQQRYKFRGIDDVYLALQRVLAKHGVFTTTEVLEERSEERATKSGGTMIYRILKIRYTFFATDGSSIQSVVIGEGLDTGDKASNKAMSVAHKYALLQTFCIPTEEPKDPENDSHVLAAKKEAGNGDLMRRVDAVKKLCEEHGIDNPEDRRAIFKAADGNLARAKEIILAGRDALIEPL